MKVFEVLDQEQSEWENHPFKRVDNDKQLRKERDRKYYSLKHQDDILATRYIALEDKYPNEIKSRGVPDEADPDPAYGYTEIPPEVEANPDAWTTIECPQRWLYDLKQNEVYDPHEEFYILKTSPRHQLVVNILERHKQLTKLKMKMYMWPPVKNETT